MLQTRNSRFVFAQFMVALIGLWSLYAVPSAFARSESWIVIDGDTGNVLTEHNADLQNYPASLTKMMTLYLAFEAVESGKLSLDERVAVSRRAAHQAPSRLGLGEGDSVAVRDLVLSVITKSANDSAVVLAERLAGSEQAFAERMTQKARTLGMTSTSFRNASGLPNRGQLTTARDLAKLARALYRDFPKEYRFFATEEFAYNGEIYSNHNRLMQSFEGMDGIKTGYIRASGYNLAASAVRDHRRLIGVVMGGQSAHARDMEMAQLLNDTFAGRRGPSTVTTVEADEDTDNTIMRRAARTIAALSPVGRAEAATPRHAVATRRNRHNGSGHWSIQVGAFSEEAAAEKAGAKALRKLPSARGKTLLVLTPKSTDSERYFRARIVNFSEHAAEKACHALHRKHLQCAVVAPSALQEIASN